jgi:DNA polymerase I-like protein with 3'-5' exonuclease and polymerase domains
MGDKAELNYPRAWILGQDSPGKALGIDTEYAPNGDLLTFGFATCSASGAVEAPITPVSGPALSNTWLIGHSVMGDVDQLVKLGLAKPEWVDGSKTIDSLLVARMIDENRGKGQYELETLIRAYYEVAPWKEPTAKISKVDATKWPEDLRRERCRLDAWASVVLAESLARQVPTKLRTFTHRIAASLHRLSLAGACVNLEVFERMGAELYQQVEAGRHSLEQQARALGMETFTPTKDADIRELLYGKLKFPVTKTTKTTNKPAVDKFTIQKMDHPVVKTLIDFNKADKSYSMFFGRPGSKREPIKQMIQPYADGRLGGSAVPLGWLPFHVNPLGARTGRRNSERPNSQNWTKSVRNIIVSRFHGGLIGAFDYKSLEPFVLAWLAQDEKLYDYFKNKGGYISIGKEILRKDVERGTVDYVIVKSVFLATTYNQLPYTLANTMVDKLGMRLSNDWDTHVDMCGNLINRVLALFPGVKRYMQARRSEVERTGQVVSATGRVRHLPYPVENYGGGGWENRKAWKRAKKRVENQAINYPVQSFAADITGSALIDLEDALCANANLSRMEYHRRLLNKDFPVMPLIVNEVHDEITIDLPNDKHVDLIIDTMQEVKSLRRLVPSFDMDLAVDANISKAWGVAEG